jgi:hypothetical protein
MTSFLEFCQIDNEMGLCKMLDLIKGRLLIWGKSCSSSGGKVRLVRAGRPGEGSDEEEAEVAMRTNGILLVEVMRWTG